MKLATFRGRVIATLAPASCKAERHRPPQSTRPPPVMTTTLSLIDSCMAHPIVLPLCGSLEAVTYEARAVWAMAGADNLAGPMRVRMMHAIFQNQRRQAPWRLLNRRPTNASKGLQVAHADRQGSAHAVILEPSPRRVRVTFNGETIADSSNMQLLHEDGHLPMYYFPIEDVRTDLLEKTDHSTHCPYKGDASYWTVRVGDREAENAVWGYEDPLPAQPGLKGLVAFYWGRMDQWFEEDEEIFVHPRDPYKRIDTIASSRQVTVTLGGRVVADTKNAVFLFETGSADALLHPAGRYRGDAEPRQTPRPPVPTKASRTISMSRWMGRPTRTSCGITPIPIAEIPKIKDLLCFYNEKVDAIAVDGQEIPKQPSPWSDG